MSLASKTEKYGMCVERWGEKCDRKKERKEKIQLHLLQSSPKVNTHYTFIKSLCTPGLYANLQ